MCLQRKTYTWSMILSRWTRQLLFTFKESEQFINDLYLIKHDNSWWQRWQLVTAWQQLLLCPRVNQLISLQCCSAACNVQHQILLCSNILVVALSLSSGFFDYSPGVSILFIALSQLHLLLLMNEWFAAFHGSSRIMLQNCLNTQNEPWKIDDQSCFSNIKYWVHLPYLNDHLCSTWLFLMILLIWIKVKIFLL